MKSKILKVLGIALISTSIMFSSNMSFTKGLDVGEMKVYAVGEGASLEEGKYNLSIEVLKENVEELSMAGQYIDKKVGMEVKNGKKYIDLKITRIDWMKNIKIFVNNKSVDYKSVEKGKDGQVEVIRFEIPDLKSNVKFQMNVVPMGNAEVKFRVVFKDDVVKLSGTSSSKSKSNKSDSKKGREEKTLKETKKDEKISEVNNVKEEEKKLPQTGSLVNIRTISLFGGLTTMLGLILISKKEI